LSQTLFKLGARLLQISNINKVNLVQLAGLPRLESIGKKRMFCGGVSINPFVPLLVQQGPGDNQSRKKLFVSQLAPSSLRGAG
jgi:hypothetical protein